MKIQRFLNTLYKNQSGSVLIIVALLMAVLLGISALVIDMGIVYNSRLNLQRAMDSSALAAVRELPISTSIDWEDEVEKVAKDFAQLNGVENSDSLIIKPIGNDGKPFDKSNITSINAKNIIGVQIIGETEVTYNFARILGFNSGLITRDAQAELKSAEGISGFVPFVLDQDTINSIKTGDLAVIKYSDNKEVGNGWFGAVRMDGTGAKDYETTIINGSNLIINIGQSLYKENGQMVGKTISGYIERIEGHEGCTFENHEKNCPRLAMIPIIKTIYDVNGNISHFEVTGFATIFLESCVEENTKEEGEAANTKKSKITVKYVDTIVAPGESIAGKIYSYNDYGVRAAKLVD